ncbi:extra spindle pole bodies 1 [Puccinia graminis f. sp. tritici]|uniref:Extra spindle pole bodies 1 n=1 Tax=Puccinia graminis f. sp. tritici TaxID=56615 RepID=A0A5B0N8V5_PUCGR|nr:extra spindle pole bodies 1 [Puccinia graminis f. sp. tritici]
MKNVNAYHAQIELGINDTQLPVNKSVSPVANSQQSRDGRWVSVADTRHPLADTRQRLRMAPFPQNPGGYPGIPKDTRGRKLGLDDVLQKFRVDPLLGVLWEAMIVIPSMQSHPDH